MIAAACLVSVFAFLIVFGNLETAFADELKLKGKAAVLIDAHTGEVLYEKNADKRYRPASMTKMMTAILVVENLECDDVVTVSKYVTTIDGSALGLKKGEKMLVEDLLNVMMIYSANDCAVALAEAVSGSVEEFAELMNKRAEELGCTGTHFANPNGLDDDNHYSTAEDMAIIARKAMEYDTIREIVRRTTYQTHETNKREVLTVGSTDRLLFDTYSWINVNGKSRHPYYKYAVGIKTGYTDLAGGCMAADAVRGDEEYISIVMKSTAFDRFADSIELLEYGFDNYKTVEAVTEGQTETVRVRSGKKREITAAAAADVKTAVSEESSGDEITTEVNIERIKAPVKEGDIVGSITVYKDGEQIGSTDLAACESVSLSIPKLLLGSIYTYTAVFFIIFLIAVFNYKKSRRHRRHRR